VQQRTRLRITSAPASIDSLTAAAAYLEARDDDARELAALARERARQLLDVS
jgi:hypothetical protein